MLHAQPHIFYTPRLLPATKASPLNTHKHTRRSNLSAANDLWRVILNAEVNSFHWTLMHRFHKAADIINEVGVWLVCGICLRL